MGLFTAAASDKASFKKLKEEGCVATFSVEVPAAKVEEQTHNHLLRIQQQARIPGFRQGKAPLELIQKQFTDHAKQEVVDQLIRKYVPEAISELKIRPVAVPSVEEVSLKPGKPLGFTVQVEIPPVFVPKDYVKIAVQRKNYPATEEAVAKRLEELREGNARLEKVSADAVAKNHYVVIDYSAARDGKPLANVKGESELVDMSSEQSVEGLVPGLLGLKRGESKAIPVKIDKKDALLNVTVKEIKEKILPPLDAEFAKDMGFETLDQVKAKLKEVIDQEGKAKTEHEVNQQIEEALLKANKIPLPPSLVEQQLEHSLERLRKQVMGPKMQWPENQLAEIRGKLRPQAENEVRISYILSSIADKEKLEASDADLNEELEKNLQGTNSDKQKAELRQMFAERKEAIAGMIRDRKTMAFVKGKAVIKDA